MRLKNKYVGIPYFILLQRNLTTHKQSPKPKICGHTTYVELLYTLSLTWFVLSIKARSIKARFSVSLLPSLTTTGMSARCHARERQFYQTDTTRATPNNTTRTISDKSARTNPTRLITTCCFFYDQSWSVLCTTYSIRSSPTWLGACLAYIPLHRVPRSCVAFFHGPILFAHPAFAAPRII